MVQVLVVDNYDSFVYNIVSYLAQLGADVTVWRNDDPRLEGVLEFDAILLSPGPGAPEDAGTCPELIRRYAGRVPIFGVCLGLQVMGTVYGGIVAPAQRQLHGKLSTITNDGAGVFQGLPERFDVVRYHSLVLLEDTMPAELVVTARTQDGTVMGVRHRELALEAVQFHPESVLTQFGYQILANWLAACGYAEAPARAEGLRPLMQT